MLVDRRGLRPGARQGRIVSTAATIATGASTDGRREAPGRATGPSEAEPFWTGFLRPLAGRGLRGVRLAAADDHKGLRAAASTARHATQQRCRAPWMRDRPGRAPSGQRAMTAARLRTILAQGTAEAAHAQRRKVAGSLRQRLATMAALMNGAEHDALAHRAFPKDHWPPLASTNPLERLNGEIKRRANVGAILPHSGAATRLVGVVLLGQAGERPVARRCTSLKTIRPGSDAGTPISLPAAVG